MACRVAPYTSKSQNHNVMYVLFVTGNKVESSLSMSFLRADQSDIQTATGLLIQRMHGYMPKCTAPEQLTNCMLSSR